MLFHACRLTIPVCTENAFKWIFLILVIYLFLFMFLAALGLCCCEQGFSSCSEWGLLCSSRMQASHCCGARALATGFSSCGPWTLEHRLSSCGA